MVMPRINVWKAKKKELVDQFLPCEAKRRARKSLKRKQQRHTGNSREYIKELSSLMMEMSAQQSKAGNISGEQSLVAALIEFNPEPLVGVPEESVAVLGKFKAGMPKEGLSRTLPPRQNLMHKEGPCEGESSTPNL